MAERVLLLKDYLLDVDPFQKPKILGNEEAIASLLVRLILLEPGTNPIFCGMGCGLVSRFRFSKADDSEIKEVIENQIETYFPDATVTDIEFEYNNDKTVDIKITVNDIQYVYSSSEIVPLKLADMNDDD